MIVKQIFVFHCHTVTARDKLLAVKGLRGDSKMRLVSPKVTG